MSRLFQAAGTEYLMTETPVLSVAPITMACWFKTYDITTGYCLMAIVDKSEDSVHFRLCARGDVAGDPIRALAAGSGTSSVAITSSGYSANTWHHACGVFVSPTVRYAYLDGGSKGTSSTASIVPANLDRTSIGALMRATPALYLEGQIAEAAIWQGELTDAEAAILAKGFSPLFIRPQNLVAYWPLIRDTDEDKVGGFDMTAYNDPSVLPHPRIIYPSPVHSVFKSSAVAGLSIPIAMHHYKMMRAG